MLGHPLALGLAGLAAASLASVIYQDDHDWTGPVRCVARAAEQSSQSAGGQIAASQCRECRCLASQSFFEWRWLRCAREQQQVAACLLARRRPLVLVQAKALRDDRAIWQSSSGGQKQRRLATLAITSDGDGDGAAAAAATKRPRRAQNATAASWIALAGPGRPSRDRYGVKARARLASRIWSSS